MEIGIKERVEQWARSGADFNAGLSLFLSFNRNVYYVRNIEAKGVKRGLTTLIAEFSNKTKVPVAEIMGMIDAGRAGINDVITKPSVLHNDGLLLRQPTDRNDNSASIEMTSRKTLKLREEFPFLGKKDCPEEFAILVNRMLTAYDDYRIEKEKLYDIDKNNLELCYQGARNVLDPYILNREIWEELNYYKVHGTVLGKVPEFKARSLRESYEAMTTVVLGNIIGNNIRRRMSYYKKQLNDKASKNKDDIRAKMAATEDEILVIKKILTGRGEI